MAVRQTARQVAASLALYLFPLYLGFSNCLRPVPVPVTLGARAGVGGSRRSVPSRRHQSCYSPFLLPSTAAEAAASAYTIFFGDVAVIFAIASSAACRFYYRLPIWRRYAWACLRMLERVALQFAGAVLVVVARLLAVVCSAADRALFVLNWLSRANRRRCCRRSCCCFFFLFRFCFTWPVCVCKCLCLVCESLNFVLFWFGRHYDCFSYFAFLLILCKRTKDDEKLSLLFFICFYFFFLVFLINFGIFHNFVVALVVGRLRFSFSWVLFFFF